VQRTKIFVVFKVEKTGKVQSTEKLMQGIFAEKMKKLPFAVFIPVYLPGTCETSNL
jgi:hypothetical protein